MHNYRFWIALLAIGCLVYGLDAQNKQLQLEDCLSASLFPDRVAQLQWQGESNNYTQIDPANQNLKQVSLKGKETPLVPLRVLKTKIRASEMRRFPRISWVDDQTFALKHDHKLLHYHLDTEIVEKITEYDPEASLIEDGPGGVHAFVKNYNLYVQANDTLGVRQVTDDGSRELTYGEAAHRYEFGITKGMFWSPDGKRLAFYRVDHSPVSDYPFVDLTQIPARHTPIKYPMAGGPSHHATVGIYDVEKQETYFLRIAGPEEQYLTNITWSPDGRYVYVVVVNRDQNYMELQRYSAANGGLDKKLFDERSTKYVEPEHGPIFLPNEPNEFLWYSERDGFNHLYRYGLGGRELGRVTEGNWVVTEVLGFDEKGSRIFIQATKEGPLDRHLYGVEIKSGKMTRLTPESGWHRGKLSGDGRYLIDEWSSESEKMPYQARVIDTKNGKIVREIFTAGNPLQNHQLGKTSLFSLKSNDGKDLFCRLIKPVDFDSTQQYPVLVYVYNGPHVQLVNNQWMGASLGRWIMLMNYFASQGYVVFTLDGRGSAYRGLAFENAVFRNLGQQEMQDQLVGVEYLKQKPWVDAERMGVLGWSYGGFMTTSLMLRQPGVFKVGVAGGPVIDWKLYEVMYTERYMDTPETNPEGYAESSLLQYIDRLQGKLCIIQGLQDDVVVPQHSNLLLREAVENNVQIDYFPYAIYKHHVQGADRLHLLELMYNYFAENL
jgi:dipeptidyl-peptidase-4